MSTIRERADWIFQTFQQKTFSPLPRPPSPAGATAGLPLICLRSTRPGATTAWRAAPSGGRPGAPSPASASPTPAVTPRSGSTLSPASPQWSQPALSNPTVELAGLTVIIALLARYLELHGLNTVGIFRVSPSAKRVKKVTDKYLPSRISPSQGLSIKSLSNWRELNTVSPL